MLLLPSSQDSAAEHSVHLPVVSARFDPDRRQQHDGMARFGRGVVEDVSAAQRRVLPRRPGDDGRQVHRRRHQARGARVHLWRLGDGELLASLADGLSELEGRAVESLSKTLAAMR